jgi:hypothetical protein
MSGDDPLVLESFEYCMPPPKVDLHSKIDKKTNYKPVISYTN